MKVEATNSRPKPILTSHNESFGH